MDWQKIDDIIVLADQLHKSRQAADTYTFQSLSDHVDEVKDLLAQEDSHWKDETVDILIHCLTLLKRHGVQDAEFQNILSSRGDRFKEKILEALDTV